MSPNRSMSRFLVRLIAALVAACSAGAATAATGHPWHDAVAEVVSSPESDARLRVTLRADGAQFERALAEWAGSRIDLEAVAVRSADDRLVAGFVAQGMQARFAAPEGGILDPADRFEMHWVGREIDGTDLIVYFEWIAPPDRRASRTPRAVEVRARLLLGPGGSQVNTVTMPGASAVTFAEDDDDWKLLGVERTPRSPKPARVFRFGTKGPVVTIVEGPEPTRGETVALVQSLARDHRVRVIQWPGVDGDAAPPARGARAGDGRWLEWARRSVAARLEAEAARDAADAMADTEKSKALIVAVDGGHWVAPKADIVAQPETRRVDGRAEGRTDAFTDDARRRYVRDIAAAATPARRDGSAELAVDALESAIRRRTGIAG